MKKYIIIKNEDYTTQEILGCFDNLNEAEKVLGEMQSDFEDDLIGYEDNYFQYENNYGNIITYQLFKIEC